MQKTSASDKDLPVPKYCKLGCHWFLGILLKNNTIQMPKNGKKIISQ